MSKPEDIEELRANINLGLREADRGESEAWDPDEVWAEVERESRDSSPSK